MTQRKRRPRRRAGNKEQSHRLIGWLVSYQNDEMGESHEIRSGRTLISSKNGLDGKVIELHEQSIAAPHSAMNASPQHQLVLQDIFSPSGTFLQRSADKDESKVNGPIEVHHGDWIRIGEQTKFQVCLIDAPHRM
ncbi:MAG: hypothetical protein KDD55_11140 [Bdellovibrionales bacterium]|nr:hypothetical protein [Bdellovibrionales bacterium]